MTRRSEHFSVEAMQELEQKQAEKGWPLQRYSLELGWMPGIDVEEQDVAAEEVASVSAIVKTWTQVVDLMVETMVAVVVTTMAATGLDSNGMPG